MIDDESQVLLQMCCPKYVIQLKCMINIYIMHHRAYPTAPPFIFPVDR